MMPMTPQGSYVSVVDPIGPAIERVRTILFRPFNLERWLVIGFCAWLAQLGSNGGGGNGGSIGDRSAGNAGSVEQQIDNAKEFIASNLHWIIPVAVGVLIFIVALILLLAWLSSRGRFMFLYCVAQNKAEIKNPWRLLSEHADRLFAFRVVLGIIGFVTAVVLIGLTVTYVLMTRTDLAMAIIGGVIGGLLFVAAMIAFGIVGKFTSDFVVPIMYLRTPSAVEAWRVLLAILSANKGRFVLYVLFQMVINIAVAAIVIIPACICCCLCCLYMLPYVGTVVLLPICVFQRSYSLFYLAQYGPQFNAFAPVVQAAPPISPPPA
jgi:hypothetical protein